MSYLVLCTIAALASCLTFFSGFGLGTLLLPAFALYFPIEHAVAMTAVVHFLNGLFKLWLVGLQADRRIVIRFGVPAILAALVGALVLSWLADVQPLASYTIGAREFQVTLVKLVTGALLVGFAVIEIVPRLRELSFGPEYLTLGGLLSGFFGGLSGLQGALRSAFLIRAGLSKDEFVATGVVIGCLIDFTRLGVYTRSLLATRAELDYLLLVAAVASAFAGAVVGNRFLKKLTLQSVQRIVAAMLLLVGIGLMAGLI